MIEGPDTYRRLSPYNMTHVLLPDSVTDASDVLDAWEHGGVLLRDRTPRFYRYTIVHADGVAIGIVGLLDVVPFGERVVGHEETMPDVGTDRRDLLKATRANLDLIVVLSPAPELSSMLHTDGRTRIDFTDSDGVRHILSDLDLDPEAVAGAVAAHPVAIADGHHRYGAAQQLLRQSGDPVARRILAFVAPAEHSGFDVEPIHRFAPSVRLGALDDAFVVEPSEVRIPSEPGVIVLATAEATWTLRPRLELLEEDHPALAAASTHVARRLLYPLLGVDEQTVEFSPYADEVVQRATRSPGGAAMLMAAVPEWAIAAAAEAGLRFPHKTTLFVPKPRAGLIIRRFAADLE